MKNFFPSQKEQLSKNVFAFIRNNKAILFNRINFQRKYLENKFSSSVTKKIAKEMEKLTPEIKFEIHNLKKIRVEITLQCNCNCDYCLVFKNKLKQINTSMDKVTAKKIISFYKRNVKNGSLMLIGGEPMLNWSIVKFFIENIKDPIKVFTNSTILNEDILHTLKK